MQVGIRGYYNLLEQVWRGCRVRCLGCGIIILTAESNRDRRDLRCEFGCRAHHDRERSNERVRIYYQSEEGRKKKAQLNARRCQRDSPNGEPPTPPVKNPRRERLLYYYRWILLVVDGIRISWDALQLLVQRIREELRQRGLPKFKKTNKVPDE